MYLGEPGWKSADFIQQNYGGTSLQELNSLLTNFSINIRNYFDYS